MGRAVRVRSILPPFLPDFRFVRRSLLRLITTVVILTASCALGTVTAASLESARAAGPGADDFDGVRPSEVAPDVPAAPDVGDDDNEWVADHATWSDIERWRTAAEHAVNVRARIESDDHTWVDTCVALEDLYLAREKRLACGTRYGEPITRFCAYHLVHVVAREGLTTGRIVYSRADLASNLAGEDWTNEPACARYVNCIAASRLGEEIALPETDETEVALAQSLQAAKADKRLSDPKMLRFYSEALAKDAELRASRGEDKTAHGRVKIEQLELKAQYFRDTAIELEKAQREQP